ncbi:MAG TPA: hypothetical protein VJ728_11905 [Candidatus Binataceae bacterium]|nr:hypothetical protein [Candidatus Binataceae bacterium]
MTDNSPPTHRAYVISQPREEGGKGFWHEVGAIWPHKNGNGFDLVLYEGISIHGRIVCIEPKDKEPEPEAPRAQAPQQSHRPQPR